MKTKLALVLGLLILAPSAYAGLSNWFQPAGPRSIFSAEVEIQTLRSLIATVPVSPTCDPAFPGGNDGIFRRTEYCHRRNPSQPQGFLVMGHDVPATFLLGYSQDDIVERWKDARFEQPSLLGKRVEVPQALFIQLNLFAARAWEKLVACADGDADRARELYRTGAFDCREEAAIRKELTDLRRSLPALASSLEVPPIMSQRQFEAAYTERRRSMRSEVDDIAGKGDFESTMRLLKEVTRLDHDVWTIRAAWDNGDLSEVLANYLPKLPRLHPLLVQVLIEEILSLAHPDDLGWTVSALANANGPQQIYFVQLLFWLNSIEDVGCSSFGMWPSANRTAIEALGDKSTAILKFLGGPRFYLLDRLSLVFCPMGRSVMPEPDSQRHALVLPSARILSVMNLGPVYYEGRLKAWRELREVRERYVTPAKP